MNIETFVLDEKNFGKAQNTYEIYPKLERTFNQYLDEYRNQISVLSSKEIVNIKSDEMRNIDILAKKTEDAQKLYIDARSIIIKKFDQLMQNSKEKENDVADYTQLIEDELNLDEGRSMINDAVILKEESRLIEALDKIYSANEWFINLLSEIRNRWIMSHKQRLLVYSEPEFGVQVVE